MPNFRTAFLATRVVLGFVLALWVGGPALAQPASAGCIVPATPPALGVPALVEPVQPPRPACEEAKTCTSDQISAYNAALAQYQSDADAWVAKQNARIGMVNAYISQLNAFNEDMQAYVLCEHDRVAAQVQAKAAPVSGG